MCGALVTAPPRAKDEWNSLKESRSRNDDGPRALLCMIPFHWGYRKPLILSENPKRDEPQTDRRAGRVFDARICKVRAVFNP